MDTLSYEVYEDEYLWFELFINGVPISELLGTDDAGIPYLIVEDDLPYWPPGVKERHPNIRIVAVCGCGEYGCSNVRASIKQTEDEVVLSDFKGRVDSAKAKQVFSVTRKNYDRVVMAIVAQARQFPRKDVSQ